MSGGCLRVSGWCLSSSGKCMGGIFVRQVENSWIRVVIFSWCSFSQWPRMSQKGAKARIRLFTGRGGFFGPGWLILLPNGLFWSTTNFWRGDGVKFWFRPFINTRYLYCGVYIVVSIPQVGEKVGVDCRLNKKNLKKTPKTDKMSWNMQILYEFYYVDNA